MRPKCDEMRSREKASEVPACSGQSRPGRDEHLEAPWPPLSFLTVLTPTQALAGTYITTAHISA